MTEATRISALANGHACDQMNRMAALMITAPDARWRPFVTFRLPIYPENEAYIKAGDHAGVVLEFNDIRFLCRFPHDAWETFLREFAKEPA